MLISIVICTYNRAAYLVKTLKSFLNVEMNGIRYEILVVDNNSSDSTYSEFIKFSKRNSHLVLRYIFEKQPGLSVARNTGILAANGDVIAFIDDDVILENAFLKSIFRTFSNSQVEAAAGRVGLKYESEVVPKWLSSHLENYLSKLDLGDESRELVPKKEWMVGANMLFRKKSIEGLKFNVRLGRIGNSLLSGEEILFMESIQKRGVKILYEPSIFLRHVIPQARTTKAFFRRRAFWGGYSSAYSSTAKVEHSFLVILDQLLRCIFNTIRWMLNLPFPSAFEYRIRALENIGALTFYFSKGNRHIKNYEV